MTRVERLSGILAWPLVPGPPSPVVWVAQHRVLSESEYDRYDGGKSDRLIQNVNRPQALSITPGNQDLPEGKSRI